MRVRLLKEKTVRDFAQNHANAEDHFKNWLQTVLKYADWKEPNDITDTVKGNLLGGGSNRVVFDIGGNGPNACRIICEYFFGQKKVHLYVNWIGTHEEYNRLTEPEKRTIDMRY